MDTSAVDTAVPKKIIRTRPSRTLLLNYHHLAAVVLLALAGLGVTDALKCHMCGQYNEGVGSITPCLNYTDQYAHLYLKECTKPSEKFCVKYVSELSTVRDCATECVEKEIWETQTYCCNLDGCNSSNSLESSQRGLLLLMLFYIVFNSIQSCFLALKREVQF